MISHHEDHGQGPVRWNTPQSSVSAPPWTLGSRSREMRLWPSGPSPPAMRVRNCRHATDSGSDSPLITAPQRRQCSRCVQEAEGRYRAWIARRERLRWAVAPRQMAGRCPKRPLAEGYTQSGAVPHGTNWHRNMKSGSSGRRSSLGDDGDDGAAFIAMSLCEACAKRCRRGRLWRGVSCSMLLFLYLPWTFRYWAAQLWAVCCTSTTLSKCASCFQNYNAWFGVLRPWPIT